MDTFPTQIWHRLCGRFPLLDNYSGRAMYGTGCIGLTGEVGDLMRFAAACRLAAEDLGLDGDSLLEAMADAVRIDCLGQQQIFYFPGIELRTSR